ncbi:MAG: helix-turn-helix transcriptional regulator [Kiritimatiellae bacterium]|nr:helix-turn-helix transcriptional regulator [Kiritimatiellia bacterium]
MKAAAGNMPSLRQQPRAVHLAPEELRAAYAAMCRTFAANLRRIREARGIKRYGAALELGVSASTWSRWEAAQRFPTPPLLAGIAALLQSPVADFFADIEKGEGFSMAAEPFSRLSMFPLEGRQH